MPAGDLRGRAQPERLTRDLLRPRHWGAWAGLGLLGLLFLLPRPLRDAIGAGTGRLAYRLGRKRREVALTNLRLCFPGWSEAEREDVARRHFRAAGRCLLDYGTLRWASNRRFEELVEIRGLEHLEQALEQGRNRILLAPHFIALDFGGIAVSGRTPTVSMFKAMRDPLSDWLVHGARSRYRPLIVERDQGLRPLIRPVREGQAFYYLPDEDLGPENSVFAPFFGVPAATLPVLGRLARLCRADVFPCLTLYVPGRRRYQMRIKPAMREFPTGDEERDAERMNAAIEDLVREAPEHYMWTLKMFRTRPPGEAGVY